MRPALACLVLLCAWCWGFEAWFADGADTSAERLLYQSLLPGIDEELFYRGVLLALLARSFSDRWTLLGASLGPAAVLSCVVFALGHSVTREDGTFAIHFLVLLYTAVPAALLVWMRQRTGSIALPVVAHNLANFGISFF